MEAKKDVIRETDAGAITLARRLTRGARYGAIAVLDPQTGAPLASRVGVATDCDGAPLILVSLLAAHTRAIIADPRCCLLLGEPGKGDALAHPRLSLSCRAAKLERGSPEHARAERRYLNRNPKAKLYVGLGDFSIFRLEPEHASLNGGFGKAYNLMRDDLLATGGVVHDLASSEQSAVDHMNADHLDAVEIYATHYARAEPGGWRISGVDIDGIDLVSGDRCERVDFPARLTGAGDLRRVLVEMARAARAAV